MISEVRVDSGPDETGQGRLDPPAWFNVGFSWSSVNSYKKIRKKTMSFFFDLSYLFQGSAFDRFQTVSGLFFVRSSALPYYAKVV
jgi:hypothetical protein